MKDIFKQLITDYQENDYSYVKPRDYDFPLNSNQIVSFIGVRRCGKTHVMYHAIKTLRKTVPVENIVYLNFEDDRIFPLSLTDLSLLPEAYYELFPDKKNELVYFFFDEIQNIENWEKFVRRIYDTEKCRIFISGSSSKLLSSELATSLRGRTLTFEIFPLSFKEFLNFSDISVNIYSSKSKAHIINALHKYLKYGGFPALLNQNERFARKTLQEYIDLIIYKDLTERYKITNYYLLRYIVKYCYSNISTLLSLNKLFNNLKSQGLQLSKNTLYNYFQHFEDAYAIFTVPFYSRSVAEQSKNPKKIYAIDIGFKTASSIAESIGHKYENAVYLNLRRKTDELFYWKENQEVDFICVINDETILINVAYDIRNTETYKREISGLTKAMEMNNLKTSFLINNEKEEELHFEGKTIKIIPLWKWLLID